MLSLWCTAVAAAEPANRTVSEFAGSVSPFIQKYCARCHNAEEHEADFRIDDIRPENFAGDLQRWEKVLEMVSIGDMPPEDELQPPDELRKQFANWMQTKLTALGRGRMDQEKLLPTFGNRVDHEELFSGRHKGPAYTPSRLWRLNEHIYFQFMQDLELGRDFVPPLGGLEEGAVDDYALLYADEAAIRTMLQNAKRVAMAMVHGRLIKPAGAGAKDPDARGYRKPTIHRELKEFADIKGEPTRQQMDDVVRYVFDRLLQREPSEAELQRYVSQVLAPNIEAGGPDAGVRGFIVAVLLSPEFLFRMELGLGEKLADGRRMLSPHELAYALSFALHDHPVEWVMQEAEEGKLKTREDVKRVAKNLLEDPELLRGRRAVANMSQPWARSKPYGEPTKPRLLRFFQEYFEYTKASDVFKDDTRHAGTHDPERTIQDADWLVLLALVEDKHVLETLLTTDHYPVDFWSEKAAKRGGRGYTNVYNLSGDPWDPKKAVPMPQGQRAGLLTHPAWLTAFSGNFETDPVRRGRWIQERLLGGVVPDIPIGVEAQLPKEPHHTIRERFRVVREAECWRCHRKMNPLGEPLEAYDDFGRFREKHHVTTDGEVLASELEMNRKNRVEASPKIPVDTTGELVGTGDLQLDGPVEDAVDLMHRLAKSDRVRQVFIRHVFRFWMGRNEMLSDSPTLMAMDKAYVESDGSFNATLLALLTSDSFLYRK